MKDTGKGRSYEMLGLKREEDPSMSSHFLFCAQDFYALCILRFHRRHNPYHTPPIPLGGDNKTQGAETIVAGGLIMASSLACWI